MQDTGSLPVNPARKLTFEEFENHTEDAWDATDDDLLRNALAKIKFESSYDQVIYDMFTKKSEEEKFST